MKLNLLRASSLWVSFLAVGTASGSGTASLSLGTLSSKVNQVSGQIKSAEDNLRIVETQYSQRDEVTADQALAKRYSDGEIQYLLGDYGGASVLFYDLVSDKQFKVKPQYGSALYYLADSLYHQRNDIGARLYLKELLSMKAADHYKEALIRFLEVAGRLNDFAGIDDYIQQSRDSQGKLLPEIAYVYGKALFKRADLSKNDRQARLEEIFLPLFQDPAGKFRLQSLYFLGVSQVQAGNYQLAYDRFQQILSAPSVNDQDAQFKELANLSLGRLLYETGKFDEALDRYQEIPRESPYFVDSLYESAWARVKKSEFDKAKNAIDILLLVAPESTTAPDAQILLGHLQLKLGHFEQATEAYNQVITVYKPVRDDIDGLLRANKDPVAYFDKLLAKSERSFDVAGLLPPVALKWATTQREVSQAVSMLGDLESGRKGVDEAQDIAHRVAKALDERSLEIFPALQEGYTRAEAVDSSLTRADQELTEVESQLVERVLTPGELAQKRKFDDQKAYYERRFKGLPETPEEVETRKAHMQSRIDSTDKEAFKLGYELQSMSATLSAIEKWMEDTRNDRSNKPEDEQMFMSRLKEEFETLNQLQEMLETVRKNLAEERSSAIASLAGESAIREEYDNFLKKEHNLYASAESRLSDDQSKIVASIQRVREHGYDLKSRVNAAKVALRSQVKRRGQQIMEKIQEEQKLIASYQVEVETVSGNARNLVGKIAFDSFKQVHRQFYDLVLKADVGIVDVAFTRKQKTSGRIQALSVQKDTELRSLDDEFKEVLKDVE